MEQKDQQEQDKSKSDQEIQQEKRSDKQQSTDSKQELNEVQQQEQQEQSDKQQPQQQEQQNLTEEEQELLASLLRDSKSIKPHSTKDVQTSPVKSPLRIVNDEEDEEREQYQKKLDQQQQEEKVDSKDSTTRDQRSQTQRIQQKQIEEQIENIKKAADKKEYRNAIELIKSVKNINMPDKDGNFLLHWAVINGHKLIVEELLKRKDINIDIVDRWKNTALHLAAETGNTEIAKLLLDNKANIDAVNEKKRTALHKAVINNNIEIVKLLVNRVANIDAVDKYGNTALNLAILSNNNINLITLLVDEGSDINAKNKKEITPYTRALYFEKLTDEHDVANYLRSKQQELQQKQNNQPNQQTAKDQTEGKWIVLRSLYNNTKQNEVSEEQNAGDPNKTILSESTIVEDDKNQRNQQNQQTIEQLIEDQRNKKPTIIKPTINNKNQQNQQLQQTNDSVNEESYYDADSFMSGVSSLEEHLDKYQQNEQKDNPNQNIKVSDNIAFLNESLIEKDDISDIGIIDKKQVNKEQLNIEEPEELSDYSDQSSQTQQQIDLIKPFFEEDEKDDQDEQQDLKKDKKIQTQEIEQTDENDIQEDQNQGDQQELEQQANQQPDGPTYTTKLNTTIQMEQVEGKTPFSISYTDETTGKTLYYEPVGDSYQEKLFYLNKIRMDNGLPPLQPYQQQVQQQQPQQPYFLYYYTNPPFYGYNPMNYNPMYYTPMNYNQWYDWARGVAQNAINSNMNGTNVSSQQNMMNKTNNNILNRMRNANGVEDKEENEGEKITEEDFLKNIMGGKPEVNPNLQKQTASQPTDNRYNYEGLTYDNDMSFLLLQGLMEYSAKNNITKDGKYKSAKFKRSNNKKICFTRESLVQNETDENDPKLNGGINNKNKYNFTSGVINKVVMDTIGKENLEALIYSGTFDSVKQELKTLTKSINNHMFIENETEKRVLLADDAKVLQTILAQAIARAGDTKFDSIDAKHHMQIKLGDIVNDKEHFNNVPYRDKVEYLKKYLRVLNYNRDLLNDNGKRLDDITNRFNSLNVTKLKDAADLKTLLTNSADELQQFQNEFKGGLGK